MNIFLTSLLLLLGNHKTRIIYFYSQDCVKCKYLEEVFFPVLRKEIDFDIESHNINLKKEYLLLLKYEKELKQEGNEVPIVVVGDEILGGKEKIMQQLSKSLLKKKNTVEINYSEIDTLSAKKIFRTKPIHIYLISKTDCKECMRVLRDLSFLKEKYPDIVLHEYDILKKSDVADIEYFGKQLDIQPSKRLIAPSLYIGKNIIQNDNEMSLAAIEEIIKKSSETGAEELKLVGEDDKKEIKEDLKKRFRTFKSGAILLAGLIDGVNPCAFATIIFFISYLSFLGKGSRQILIAGILFTLGVFLTYIIIGLGLFEIVKKLTILELISRIVYYGMSIFLLVLSILSFKDAYIARKENFESDDLSLVLPSALKKLNKRIIRWANNTTSIYLTSMLIGSLISMVSFVCTGQIYLPTIMYVLGEKDLKVQAHFFLVLYNIAFILPLVAVFIIVFAGVRSEQLGSWMNRNLSLVKILTGIVFLALGLLLFWITYK
ncbi:MAG: cytochrome c biogenesis protein CcdA [Candidatus Coatesbacteria bacterium]|nr:cytochrome c biogenesis protein CcdA [Candidatus Coatesbacteria bacterium]